MIRVTEKAPHLVNGRGEGTVERLRRLSPYLIALLLVWIGGSKVASDYRFLACMDVLLMLALCYAYRRRSALPWPLIACCLILFFSDWTVNQQRNLMIPTDEYANIVDRHKAQAVQQVLDADSGWYRLDQLGTGSENKANINRLLDIRQNITSLYSSGYNGEYQQFRDDIFQLNEPFRNNMMQSATDNPCFLAFMGVKYVLADKAPAGYQLWNGADAEGVAPLPHSVFCNEFVAPLAYVTDQVMGQGEYEKLAFPDRQTALLQRAVVPEKQGELEKEFVSDGGNAGADAGSIAAENAAADAGSDLAHLAPCQLKIPEMAEPGVSITAVDGGYRIEVKKKIVVEAQLFGAEAADTLLALSFQVENLRPKQDMYIRVAGQTNRLTSVTHEYANHNTEFTYMVTMAAEADGKRGPAGSSGREERAKPSWQPEGVRRIGLELGKGEYHISSLQAFAGTLEEMQNTRLYEHALHVDGGEPQGDYLTGSVDAERDGYLITSIPFDENFTVQVDGKFAEPVKVNTAFLGARIPRGRHKIAISYRAPGKSLGMAISGMGLILLAASAVRRRRNAG